MKDDYYKSIEYIYHKAAPQKKRKSYHVVPGTAANKKKVWKVKLAGRSTVANGVFSGKVQAVLRAKELAKKAKLGQVLVHKLDGTIQTEYTYGNDPKKTKG